jgi:hypothetical protein
MIDGKTALYHDRGGLGGFVLKKTEKNFRA